VKTVASIKKKSSGGGGANWMDTYGDMVTLLLCFFVLLYSISTINEDKWLIVVKSFNKDFVEAAVGPAGSQSEDQSGGDGLPATDSVEKDLDELYLYLKEYAAEQAEGTVTVSQGDGYVFVSFSDAVFFAGDSSVLLQHGKDVLDDIIPALDRVGPSVDELRILGHTAQAGNTPNPTMNDRLLSGERASVVAAYIQDRIPSEQLAPGRIVAIGNGQWRNAAPNDTPEGKARNRRVELIITGRDLEDELSDSFEQYQTMLKSTSKAG